MESLVVTGLVRCWFVKELSLLNAGEEVGYTVPKIDADVKMKYEESGHSPRVSLNLSRDVKKIMTRQAYDRIYYKLMVAHVIKEWPPCFGS
jgi:hypothetical protein